MSTNRKYRNKLEVESSTANLAVIREFIEQTAVENDISDEIKEKIMLSVDEACTNIIKHAYKMEKLGRILVDVIIDDVKYKVKITDKGKHFDPDKIPEPNIIEYHNQKRGGGLGMYLMKKLMDEVKYKTLANESNQVVLIKYLA